MANTGIKHWPKSERPRELLLEKGPQVVSDAGLVAILLRSGTQDEDAVALARRLIAIFGGITGLLHASSGELAKVKGMGPAKIATLLSAMEIAKRKSNEEIVGKSVANSSKKVFELLAPMMKGLKKEVFKVLFLDQSNRVIAIEDLPTGTVNQSVVFPREVIKRALELEATGLIFAHNHPGGTCKPSNEDIEMTKKLFKACEAVELRALDHVILTESSYVSLNDFI